MFDFYEKRKLKGIIFSNVSIGLVLVAGFFVAISAYQRFKAERETAEKLEIQKTALEDLSERAAVLESEVEMLESERGVEAEIRDRFDVTKPNEKVIVILEEGGVEEDVSTTSPVSARSRLFDWLLFW